MGFAIIYYILSNAITHLFTKRFNTILTLFCTAFTCSCVLLIELCMFINSAYLRSFNLSYSGVGLETTMRLAV